MLWLWLNNNTIYGGTGRIRTYLSHDYKSWADTILASVPYFIFFLGSFFWNRTKSFVFFRYLLYRYFVCCVSLMMICILLGDTTYIFLLTFLGSFPKCERSLSLGEPGAIRTHDQ